MLASHQILSRAEVCAERTGILVRVLQRHRTNGRIYKEIYYKELAHAIVDAGKSQELQGELASWRPRRTNGLVLIWLGRPKNKGWWWSFSLKASRFRTQESWYFRQVQRQEKANISGWKQSGRQNSLFLRKGLPFFVWCQPSPFYSQPFG